MHYWYQEQPCLSNLFEQRSYPWAHATLAGISEEFSQRTARVCGEEVEILEPASFAGQVSEARLEDIVLRAPQVLGEELLPLGHQLADFSEDLHHLDVLAVDRSGEIVLIELKVDDQFGFTELQALGYAGGYADLPTSHYAKTLQRAVASERGAIRSEKPPACPKMRRWRKWRE